MDKQRERKKNRLNSREKEGMRLKLQFTKEMEDHPRFSLPPRDIQENERKRGEERHIKGLGLKRHKCPNSHAVCGLVCRRMRGQPCGLTTPVTNFFSKIMFITLFIYIWSCIRAHASSHALLPTTCGLLCWHIVARTLFW